MSAYCEVALPVPLDRTFTYALPDGHTARRGARVIAPFRNEKLIGVITAIQANALSGVDIRNVDAVLDDEPLLSDHLLALAEWIAQYYVAPLGEVLRAMLPLMAEVRRAVSFRITDLGRDKLAAAIECDPGQGIIGLRGAESPQQHREIERQVLERLASGEPIKVSTLRSATGASQSLLAGMAR